MKCALILAAFVLACLADQPALFQPALNHNQIMNIIRQHYEASTGTSSVFGKRELKEKRFLGGLKDIFHKIEHFATDHLGDLITVGETLGPVLLGKRETEVQKRFLGGLKDIFHKIEHFATDHLGDLITVGETLGPVLLGKRDAEVQKRFLGGLKDIFHKIEHFATDHLGDLITVGETLGPALLGKRSTNYEKRFLGKLKDAFSKAGNYLKNHVGDIIKVGETVLPLVLIKKDVEQQKRFLGGLKDIFHKIEHFATDHLGDLITVGETLGPVLLGKRETEVQKRFLGGLKDIFHKIEHFATDHLGDLITVGETLGPALLGKRATDLEKRNFGDKIKHAFQNVGKFVGDHLGDLITIGEKIAEHSGKRDAEQQKRFLGGLKDIFHKIEHFATDHLGDLITVGETLGPALLGKRATDLEKRNFGDKIKHAFQNVGKFVGDHLGDLITIGEKIAEHSGKRDAEQQKRFLGGLKDIFHKIEHFATDHLGDLITVGETLGPVLLGKREADFAAYPPVVQEFKHLIDTQQALLHHGNFENTFFGFVDKLNYLDRFTHTHSLERRGFFDNIANTFKNLGSSIKSGAEKVGQFFSAHLGEIASGALKVLPSVIPAAVSLLGKREVADLPAKFGEIVKTDALEIFQKIRDAYEGAMNMSHNLINSLKESAQKVLGGENIKEMAQNVISVLSADIKNMLNKGVFHLDLDQLLGDLIPNAVQKLFGSHINKRFLLADAGAIFGDLKGLVSNGLTGLKDVFSGIVNTAKTAIAPTLENVKALAATFLSNATQLTAKAASEAVTFFKPFAGVLGPIFTKIQSLAQPLLG